MFGMLVLLLNPFLLFLLFLITAAVLFLLLDSQNPVYVLFCGLVLYHLLAVVLEPLVLRLFLCQQFPVFL